MKIGKTEIDNNLILLLVVLLVAYFIFKKIKSGVGTIFGANPDDVEQAKELEVKSEIDKYSPLTYQFSKNIFDKATYKERIALNKKGQWTQAQNVAKKVDDLLSGIYVSDEDANRVIGLIDTFITKYNVSIFAQLYPKYARGANLEADMKKYLDADELAELFKRINKKPIK